MDIPGGCVCEHPSAVHVRCIRPYNEECRSFRVFDTLCPSMISERLEESPTMINLKQFEKNPDPGSIPGFGLIEVFLGILSLLGFIQHQKK